MKDKVLGVIGGMGPLATDIFYRDVIELTEAECDQDHIDMVILSHASMPDRTSAIEEGDLTGLLAEMKKDFQILEAAGATLAVITCNTAHVVYRQISELTDMPVLHMPLETAKYIRERYGEGAKAGILATDGTVKREIYHSVMREQGLVPVDVSEECQKRVMNIIYGCVKKGLPPDMSDVEAAVNQLAECSCIVLGCTELSAVADEVFTDDRFIDPMKIAARIAIPAAGGKLRDGKNIKDR